MLRYILMLPGLFIICMIVQGVFVLLAVAMRVHGQFGERASGATNLVTITVIANAAYGLLFPGGSLLAAIVGALVLLAIWTYATIRMLAVGALRALLIAVVMTPATVLMIRLMLRLLPSV